LSSVIKVDKIQSDTGTVNVASKIEFPAGTVSAPSIFPTGDINTGIFFPAADTIAFAEGGAEAMRIDSSGRVGIGTSSPGEKLTVQGDLGVLDSSSNLFSVTTSDLGTTTFFTNNGAGTGGTYGQYIWLSRRGSNPTLERMRIDSSGNLQFNSGYGSVATAYGCRAWVNFDGTGTPAIRGSGNVSSVSDIGGNGNYTVNFTTVMPDVNYSAVITSRATGTNLFSPSFASGFSTGNMNFITVNSSGVATDSDTVCCAVFR
jgi:hypothetical protein